MKNWLCKWVPALVILCLAGSALGQGRMATIELNKVFDNYWKTKQAQGVLKERQNDMEKELKNMLEDQKKAREAYEKLVADAQDQAVSADEREKRKTAAQEKFRYLKEQEDTINQYSRQARVTLDEQLKRMKDAILTEIRNAVDAKARAASYTLVIDTSAESVNRTPIFLYSSGENDITQQVLQQLNATAPPASEEPKSEKKTDEKSDGKKK